LSQKGRNSQFRFTCMARKEGRYFVAYCKEAGISSFGSCLTDACNNLQDALQTLICYAQDNDRLDLLTRGSSLRVAVLFFFVGLEFKLLSFFERKVVTQRKEQTYFQHDQQVCCA